MLIKLLLCPSRVCDRLCQQNGGNRWSNRRGLFEEEIMRSKFYITAYDFAGSLTKSGSLNQKCFSVVQSNNLFDIGCIANKYL